MDDQLVNFQSKIGYLAPSSKIAISSRQSKRWNRDMTLLRIACRRYHMPYLIRDFYAKDPIICGITAIYDIVLLFAWIDNEIADINHSLRFSGTKETGISAYSEEWIEKFYTPCFFDWRMFSHICLLTESPFSAEVFKLMRFIPLSLLLLCLSQR